MTKHLTIARILAAVCIICTFLTPATAIGAPTIFWASDPVGPGETVMLIGESLDGVTDVTVRQVGDRGVTVGRSRGITIKAESAQSLAAVLPGDIGDGLYQITLKTRQGSVRKTLNAPAIYWHQTDGGDHAVPGGWVRVFGRNIVWPDRPAELELTAAAGTGGRGITLISQAGGRFDATFPLPDALPAGQYSMTFSSGHGGEQGRVALGDLSVRTPERILRVVLNVRDFGAIGDGKTDDARAIQSALDAAAGEAIGAIVRIPRGRFLVGTPLTIAEGVVLEGADRNLAALMFKDFDKAPEALIAGTRDFTIRDLTIYATNHRRIISGQTPKNAGDPAGGVVIERIRVRASRYFGNTNKPEQVRKKFAQDYGRFNSDVITIGGANNRIVDNDLYGSNRSIYLRFGRDTVIARNTFHHGRVGWYAMDGTDRVIFEDNEIVGADLMSTGGGIRNNARSPASRNVFFARNRFRLLHGWDREAMTTDGSGSAYFGLVDRISQGRYRLREPLSDRGQKRVNGIVGLGVFVMAGRGRGQMRSVRAFDDGVVELDREFDLPPDDSSTLIITATQENYILVDNTFEDTGSAIQFYGTSINHIVAGNTLNRASGIFITGRWYRGFQPSWYCQVLDNRIIDGNTYHGGPNSKTFAGEGLLSIEGRQLKPDESRQRKPNRHPLAFGAIVRRNTLEANARIRLNGGRIKSAPGLADVVVEDNSIAQSDVGIEVQGHVERAVLRNNRFYQTLRDQVGVR